FCTWLWGQRTKQSNGWNVATRKAPASMLSFSKSIPCSIHCKTSRDFRPWWLKFSLRSNEDRRFLHRAEAPQRLQGCDRLRGNRVVAHSGRVDPVSHLRSAGVSDESCCREHRRWVAER